jgi:hypothetical protein
LIDQIYEPDNHREIGALLKGRHQYRLLNVTKQIHDEIEKSELMKGELGHLCEKIKDIWHLIL